MMILVIHPSCLNMIPAIPLMIVRGMNTASIVNVDAITEIPTSWVACTAASLGFAPFSRCVEIFSNTTMASSTTIPIAMDRADIDTMFNVFPVAQRYISDARREIGIARMMMNVDLHLPRKRYTTSITIRKVTRMVSLSEFNVLRMLCELSITVVMVISEGRFFSIFFISFLIPLITLTALASACFWITIWAPCTPLITASWYLSSTPSTTRATSRR